jgi:hypothetical protein
LVDKQKVVISAAQCGGDNSGDPSIADVHFYSNPKPQIGLLYSSNLLVS